MRERLNLFQGPRTTADIGIISLAGLQTWIYEYPSCKTGSDCCRRKAVCVMLSPMDELIGHIRFKRPNSSLNALYQIINRLVSGERYRYNPITVLFPPDHAVSAFSLLLHSPSVSLFIPTVLLVIQLPFPFSDVFCFSLHPFVMLN